MYKFFLYKNDENDATSYYLQIIKEAVEQMGDQVYKVYSLSDIEKNDKVITIQARAFWNVYLHNRGQYIINWFQGIVPEESLLICTGIYRYIRYAGWRFLEYMALRKAKKIFFVSKKMQMHYASVYGYRKSNFFVMPCFNQSLHISSFRDERYLKPTFVYIGSLAKWQCIDKTLVLYKRIYSILPSSTLTLLTKEKEKAQALLEKYEIDNAIVKYVPLLELDEELAKYKYGFLIREDIAVNNVATPTKMNSYMANGVIPILSDIIGDFHPEFDKMKYVIRCSDNIESCINSILELEKRDTIAADVLREYQAVFERYYSKSYYISEIQHFLNGTVAK